MMLAAGSNRIVFIDTSDPGLRIKLFTVGSQAKAATQARGISSRGGRLAGIIPEEVIVCYVGAVSADNGEC